MAVIYALLRKSRRGRIQVCTKHDGGQSSDVKYTYFRILLYTPRWYNTFKIAL
jgi:hypothetical protein